jgi:small GTP-binding protein
MPINATAEYYVAEKKYLNAKSKEERIAALQEMIKELPKHKGTEHLLSQLKGRLKRLKEEAKRASKAGARQKFSIKKEGAATVCLIGMTNSGKSSLLNLLTAADAEVADYPFTTKIPEVGMMYFKDLQIQIIEIPSTLNPEVASLLQIADEVVVLLDATQDFYGQREAMSKVLKRYYDSGKPCIFVANKIDEANSKSSEFLQISTHTGQGIEELKEKILDSLNLIRVYTKKPGKQKDFPALGLKKNSSVDDVLGLIHKDFRRNFKFARIFNSKKHSGQKVGLDYRLEDGDVIEIHTS